MSRVQNGSLKINLNDVIDGSISSVGEQLREKSPCTSGVPDQLPEILETRTH